MDINGIVEQPFIVVRDGNVIAQAPTESMVRDLGGRLSKFNQNVVCYRNTDMGMFFSWREIAAYSDGKITFGRHKAASV